MNTLRRTSEKEIEKLLKAKDISFSSLSDVPLSTIRHAQRGAFPDMRITQLAPKLRDEFLKRPITRDLLCMRSGFQGASPAHYIPRPSGSYDCIFIYCTGGRGWLEIDGESWPVEKYDGFLVPRHTPHAYGSDPDNPWINYWIHFQGRQADEYSKLIRPPSGSPIIHLPRHHDIVAGIEQIYQYMSRVHTYPTLVAATGALSQLLGIIQLRMMASESRARSAEENLDKTVDFMHSNLTRQLTLKELASIAGMSPNHYGVLFAKRYNSTPIEYFNRLKIQRACELLTTTSNRIGEVGEQLGFSDQYYFSRVFKKVMGISPKSYR